MAKIDPKDNELLFRHIPYAFRRFSVKDKDLTAPPGGPAEGDRYIVGASATGLWSGHDDEMVEWHAVGSAAAAWIFQAPWMGFRTYVEDEGVDYEWNGTAWKRQSGVADGVKFYLSDTTETYWIYTGGKVELWVNGIKTVIHP